MNRLDVNRTARPAQLLRLAGAALMLIVLSGCAGWGARQRPQLAPAPPAPEPFALNSFELRDDTDVVGRLRYTTVQGEETLLDIARAYDLGYDEILAANPGIDPWTPASGQRVLLPTAHVLPDAPREGIVINLAARRLYYYPPRHEDEPARVITHPIGIGREGWATPLGRTKVAKKHAAPAWTVPASIRREHAAKGDPLPAVVPPGPENPLGSHALRLGWSSILIHGTSKPAGIGMRVSHGCMQLYPEDIAPLFEAVPVGTPVTVVDQPYLAGVGADGLLLEAHEPVKPMSGTRREAAVTRAIEAAIARHRLQDTALVDLDLAQAHAGRHAGYPLPIDASAPAQDAYLAALPAAPPLPSPHVAPVGQGEWYVDLGRFKSENNARRLVAMLTHQGPPIPALRVSGDGQHRVLAGPYPSKALASAAARRIERDLSETGQPIRLAPAVASNAAPPSAMLP
ncbi:MAG: L,D-transpeptidase family protein [Immundisolibacter sp.]|uniref:L,D-transpeptidase family protein n=1 Tax=Immundisolibacter sp. TaxID=1934948 RepID=UPI0019C09092|nr:L,D-transpeptidase family protein [Immundisolibacter sp.]MBC7162873.1 L,D-transpeptidase family protein [Immundisolibacter sp.]